MAHQHVAACVHWLRYGRIECHKFVDMEEMTLKELREKLVDNEMLRFLDERRTLARDSICLACYISLVCQSVRQTGGSWKNG